MNGEPLNILLVEDNEDHAELVKRSFENHRIANVIHHVMDGEEALDYLLRREKYQDPQDSPVPHIILLDLRLPKVDGLEVLKEIRSSKSLKSIPIVILSTSKADSDLAKAYDYHVNSYLVKPVDFEKFSQLIDDLGFYWLAWNQKP
ncbi:MAG: response regulator [Deltaproteobacteria bacterium]|mgnify:CR=1 FL=1|jgi:two-component system, response regulator|nr:response regulator [Deltaproteobacteria bacterium]MBT4090994.1 response regulator [Deltaproteobacteria bacterium]MBT4263550.1 response regulator [Deltaproteobacteria bacterium]MBT4644676.1 response regulator [Deltaproteobacteria bacterium]MBT6500629.1 response regulator [Deltaproteobacteria bacterium]